MASRCDVSGHCLGSIRLLPDGVGGGIGNLVSGFSEKASTPLKARKQNLTYLNYKKLQHPFTMMLEP